MLDRTPEPPPESTGPISHWPFLQVPNVSVDEHAVHLRVNSLYEHLEAVEGASFRDLHLLTEPLHLFDQTQMHQAKTLLRHIPECQMIS